MNIPHSQKPSILNYNKTRNYLIVILLLLYHNSPFFFGVRHTMVALLFCFILLLTNFSSRIFNKKIFLVLCAVWLLIAIQTIQFGGFTRGGVFNPLVNFYMPFLVFVLMGVKFYKYLFNIIFFIAIYTTAIYLLQTISPAFNEYMTNAFFNIYEYSWADWPRTLLVYNIPRESGYYFMRNSGIFHEPGAYSIYLMLAIIINTYFTQKPFNPKNIFLMLVVLTTFSTTGYLMLGVFFAYAIITFNIPVFFKVAIIVPLLVSLSVNVYKDTDFLGPKIEDHLVSQLEYVERGEIDRRGRIYAFGMSVKSFINHPLTGRGILTTHQMDVGEIGSFGYGFPGLFARYGMFFALFYMFFFYKGFRILSNFYEMPRLFTITSFLIINIGLLTQAFFMDVPFSSFFMLGLFYRRN